MKKHLMFSCFGFAAWGVSWSTMFMGKGLNIWVKLALFVGGMVFYLYTTLAHLPEIRHFIDEHESKQPMFDFENEKNNDNGKGKTTAGETANV